MAKRRKKHHTTHHRRRRRMGAVVSHGLTANVMEVGGVVAGSVLATIAQRQLSTINPKVISAGEIAVGFYLKQSPHPFTRGVGWGVLGAGAIGLTHEVGLIHGLEDMVSGLMQPANMYEVDAPAHTGGFGNSQHVNSFSGFPNGYRVAGDSFNDSNIPPIGF